MLCLESAIGAGWQIITSPNGSRQVNELQSVSALAENDVWAAGVSCDTERTLGSTLIEHWNGSQWSVVPSPNPSSTLNILYGVAAVATNDVWAIGSGRIGDEDATLTLHWNGTAWSFISSPNVTPEVDNTLSGVAAVASNDVWAVGTQQPTSLTDPSRSVFRFSYRSRSGNDGGKQRCASPALAKLYG